MPDNATTAASLAPTVDPGCVFCSIVAGTSPAVVVRRWAHALAIVPLRPVVTGHTLVIPTTHVPHVAADPAVSAATMAAAAGLAAMYEHCNVITSRGIHATQTCFHLHLHVVPRNADDGLPLPWTPQAAAA